MEKKPCSNSRTVKTAQILPPDANAYGTLFGGKLMAHIDDVAAISAVRHARKSVVTASTDSVDFLHPVKVGDSICVEGFVTSVHNTSMEVFVKVVKEGLLTAEKTVCATAFLTFVALGENGKPDVVPRIYPETEMEKMLYEGAELRRERRNERKKESQRMAKLFSAEF
ncbi:acyl-CoA thioesterase [Pseudogracilibacillus sp. SO30301A]|uniref:acyl-CoA thioesterase n=1 Tax=Pseudogracilibacillus sp. SO30301A TaxID=3098291 RepID=UPI00300E54E2